MTHRFTRLTDLASSSVGGKILFATDEWFAAADNLINSESPKFDPNTFTEYGKEMDGWESRRKRQAGHDWCILRLGLPGIIHGVVLDTAYFTGNQTPRVSIQYACFDAAPHKQCENEGTDSFENDPVALRGLRTNAGIGTCASPDVMRLVEEAKTDSWQELVPFMELKPGYEDTRFHYVEVPQQNQNKATHLRINYFPDGGVARLRVHGIAKVDFDSSSGCEIDLIAAENGGMALACSNAHYGNPSNLIAPNRANNMGEGWETARNPNRPPVFKLDENGHLEAPGKDWCILKLAIGGKVCKIEVDTNHFKGNYPESCIIEACNDSTISDSAFDDGGSKIEWFPLLKRTTLEADARQYFELEKNEVENCGSITHVRLTIFPDGGISRLRLHGMVKN